VKTYTLVWIVITLGICKFAHAQDKNLDTLLKKFDRFRLNGPQEKLYVHTDQGLYLTGETLWFKIYAVDGARHYPADLSKVAYVEVIDHSNKAVLQTKIALKNGSGFGNIFIPASINSGNYYLRAYTNWMKNFSADYFFHKPISIVNSFRKLEKENITVAKGFKAQFFPEGGNLVYGLKSKVAFQALDSKGKGVNADGLLLNTTNDTVTTFEVFKHGIGAFTFTPIEGSTYRAVMRDSLGNIQTFDLPVPLSFGYVIQVQDSTPDVVSIRVTARDLPSTSAPLVYLFIHARQILTKATMAYLRHGEAMLTIPKHELNEGISHITVFDSNLKPQCERLYFKPSQKKLAINVQASQMEYGVRRKVVLEMANAGNSKDQGVANLSVAVVKTDSLQPDLNGNIFHHLWLSSDLRGEIEAPAYYSQADTPEVMQAVDNLILTHGWRRFTWNDILDEDKNTTLFLPEYRGHLIRGTVYHPDGKPASGIPTYLSTPGKNIQLYTARSKANGELLFEMKEFWGPRKIIVSANTEQDSTVQIKIHSPYADIFAERKLLPLQLAAPQAKSLLTRSVAMQVQDVYYAERANKFAITSIDSAAFYGKATETYYLDDYTRFPVMEEVMREYVPGVMVRKRRDGFHFLVLDNVRKSLFKDEPLVLLDGMPIFDVDKIMEFDPLKVRKLEVVTNRYFLGPLNFPGIVSYSTYTGDLNGFIIDPKAVSLDYDGLQRQQIFYAPQYDNQKQRESRMPDRRNVLYWDPQVTLDEQGKRQVEFYTSDMTGTYTIIIEGLSDNGYSGTSTRSFTVKEFNN
jgi:hypothetical protein